MLEAALSYDNKAHNVAELREKGKTLDSYLMGLQH